VSIRFVQTPTTLPTLINFSVGGKTAVNNPYGKKFIAPFWHCVKYVPHQLSLFVHSPLRFSATPLDVLSRRHLPVPSFMVSTLVLARSSRQRCQGKSAFFLKLVFVTLIDLEPISCLGQSMNFRPTTSGALDCRPPARIVRGGYGGWANF